MLYKCSKCGEEFEKELHCKKHEENHRRYDSPILLDGPVVYEGYFTIEPDDYGPSFMTLDNKYLLGEGSASNLITYSNINSEHALDDYKGRPMRITINAEFLDEPNTKKSSEVVITKEILDKIIDDITNDLYPPKSIGLPKDGIIKFDEQMYNVRTWFNRFKRILYKKYLNREEI